MTAALNILAFRVRGNGARFAFIRYGTSTRGENFVFGVPKFTLSLKRTAVVLVTGDVLMGCFRMNENF